MQKSDLTQSSYQRFREENNALNSLAPYSKLRLQLYIYIYIYVYKVGCLSLHVVDATPCFSSCSILHKGQYRSTCAFPSGTPHCRDDVPSRAITPAPPLAATSILTPTQLISLYEESCGFDVL